MAASINFTLQDGRIWENWAKQTPRFLPSLTEQGNAISFARKPNRKCHEKPIRLNGKTAVQTSMFPSLPS